MVDWYKGFDEKVRRAFDEMDADRHSELASRGFQKDLVKACAEEVIQVILEEIGDSRFSILIDDTHDIASKEHMGIILRLVAAFTYIFIAFYMLFCCYVLSELIIISVMQICG